MTSVVIEPGDTKLLSEGANTVRIFALSETVLRPDIYEAGFLAVSPGGADLGMAGGGDVDAGIGSPDAPEAGPPGGGGAPAVAAPTPDAAADESSLPYAVAAGLALAALGAAAYWVRKRKTQASDMMAAVSGK